MANSAYKDGKESTNNQPEKNCDIDQKYEEIFRYIEEKAVQCRANIKILNDKISNDKISNIKKISNDKISNDKPLIQPIDG